MTMGFELLIFLAGLAVYAGYGMTGLVYLAAVTVLSFLAGRMIPKHPWVMWAAVAVNALALTVMKLQPLTGMALPAVIGISYFTLKVMS